MTEVTVGIDIGTTSVKAVACRRSRVASSTGCGSRIP